MLFLSCEKGKCLNLSVYKCIRVLPTSVFSDRQGSAGSAVAVEFMCGINI